jgi:tetratricopeptide (TPR) repeat protein
MVAAMRQPGQAARAREAATALLDDDLKALGPASPEVVNTWGLIARACEELRDFAGAAEAYGHAAESAALLKDPAQVQIWKQAQAQSLVDAGLASHAEGPLRQALEITRASGRRGLHVVTLNRELATVMKAAGRHADRAAALREALAFAEGGPPSPPGLAGELKAELAAALADAGGVEEAERLYREALRGLAEHAPGGKRRNAAAEELAAPLERLGRGEDASRVRAEHAGKVAPDAEDAPGAVGGAEHGGGV